MRYNKKIFLIMFSIFTIAVLVSFSYAHFVKDDAQGNEISSINMITKSSEDLTNIAEITYKTDFIINTETITDNNYSKIYKLKIDYLVSEANKISIYLKNIMTNINISDATIKIYECNEINYNNSTINNVNDLCILKTSNVLSSTANIELYNHTFNSVQTKYYVLQIDINDNMDNYFNATIKVEKYVNPYSDGVLLQYNGSYREITIPENGIYKIELWGASGGDGHYNLNGKSYNPLINSSVGGKGAYVSGNLNLDMNKSLFLYIGQQGMKMTSNNSVLKYNGGGYCFVTDTASGQGGGATDIRLVTGNWNNTASLYSRIMVAAAGGGGGESGCQSGVDYSHANGGNAGGLNGEIGGKGIFTTANTVFSTQILSSGTIFGVGGNGRNNNDCGGGGGGYYGGQGGISNTAGGGGSSFISGHTGCIAIANTGSTTTRLDSNGVLCSNSSSAGYNGSGYNTDPLCSQHYSGNVFTNTLMIDGAGYKWEIIDGALVKTLQLMPNPLGGFYASGVGHTGNGYARITYLRNE